MIPRRLSALICCSLAFQLTVEARAQHFAPPPQVNRSADAVLAEPVAVLSKPTTSFGAAASEGWLYVLGGYTGRPHDYHRQGQSHAFYRINLHNLDHRESLPNEGGVQSCPLVSWEGLIIRVGGMIALNESGEEQELRSLDNVVAFDPAQRLWSPLPKLPEPRSSHDAAIIGSTLYVVGGWTLADDESRTWHDDLLAFDLRDASAGWRAQPAPFQRRALACAAVDGKLVVIGGMTSKGEISTRVNVFDPETGSWRRGPDLPASGFGVAAASVGDRVVVSGADGRVFTWKPGTDRWRHAGTLTFPRFFHQVAPAGSDTALFLGGISRGVRPVHVERLDLDGGSARRADGIVASWTVPSPAPAKNRQGLLLHDGWLHAFGGNNSTGQHDFQPDNFLAESWRLSIAGLQWELLPPMPARRQSTQTITTVDGSEILVIGGFGHDGDVARTFSDGFAFDPRERTWRELGDVLPTPRSQFALTEHHGRFWAIGGLDYDPRRSDSDQFRHLTPVVSSQAASGIRFERTDLRLPNARRAFGGAELGGRFYLIGGMTDDFELVETCEALDFESETFRAIPSPSRPRLSPELVALDGRLYLAGGMSPREDGEGLEPNPSIEVFDPATSSWSVLLDNMPLSPRHMRMMPFRGRLLLFSTHDADHRVARIVLIDPKLATSGDPVVRTSR